MGNDVTKASQTDATKMTGKELVRRKNSSDEMWSRISGFAFYVYYNSLFINKLLHLESLRNRKRSMSSAGNAAELNALYGLGHAHILGDENEVPEDNLRMSESIKNSLKRSVVLISNMNSASSGTTDNYSLRIFLSCLGNADICRIIASFL